MAAGHLLMCLSAIVLTILARPASLTQFDYGSVTNRVCYHLEMRKLSISFTRPLLYRELGGYGEYPGEWRSFSCQWRVDGKGSGLGVVAVIQRLRFRSEGHCIDHITFRESGARDSSRNICGSIVFGIPVNQDLNFMSATISPTLPPTPPTTPSPPPLNVFVLKHNPWRAHATQGAVIDPQGELMTYVHVANRPLNGDKRLLLTVAYTAFQVCDGSSVPSFLFHCGYGLCISWKLVNDGVVNCPFGNCIDEGNCSLAKESEFAVRILDHSTLPKDPGGVNPGFAAMIAIATVIGISFGFLLARSYFLRRLRDRQGSQR